MTKDVPDYAVVGGVAGAGTLGVLGLMRTPEHGFKSWNGGNTTTQISPR